VISKIVGDHGYAVLSETVNAVGQGLGHGYSISLPNAGGQWALNLSRPILMVGSAASGPEQVQRLTDDAVARIHAELVRRQRDERVAPTRTVRTRLSPPTPTTVNGTGSRGRALVISELLRIGLTIAVALAVDRRLRRPDVPLGDGSLGLRSTGDDLACTPR
jgi:hypothetical protein